ncbi:MerR family transcriptional regulator [Hwanghaeella grinnelliae]|uniref:MerR family transcriptional regulator n=1 Tax=Hwanghaeella grinnelliae TaxID=2500179 RepID=A0A3S3UQD5_9PROT|nr:MerR family transcriptional regulator [Hwanghaeella grinnelliae]RVU38106.1 MerR family transcriptional regulator [Hwanghaeella grinnelliae]
MKIGELGKRTGLSVHTIRYYERIGLLPPADRDASGQRDYDGSVLVWIGFLERLKTTGMPIREMLRYAELRTKGDHTGPERREILEMHRDRVRAHLADLQASLLVLDTKIDTYVDLEKRTRKHDDTRPPSPGNRSRAGKQTGSRNKIGTRAART